MAISKTQPMRSAEIEILDKVNELDIAVDSNTTSLGLLTDALGAEVSDRQLADTSLGNRIDTEIQQRESADSGLSNRISGEVTTRADADTALGLRIDGEITNRVNSDSEIMNIIGTDFSSGNTVSSNVSGLQEFNNRFRIGLSQPYTIAPNTTQAVSMDFNTPYESTDEVLVFVNPVAANESFTDIKCSLDSAGYLGFSATVENLDTVNSYTVALGFIAVKVN